MRSKGKISYWNDEKSYGFIDPISGGKRVFIHISAFFNRSRRPAMGQVVTYALSTDKQGRPCAVKAKLAEDGQSKKIKKPNGSLSIATAVIFLLIVGAAVLMSKTPPVIFAVYLITSLITFVTYAKDKAAARKGTWRTEESTLHVLSLFGGWPGALIAQQKLRHKSKKRSFRVVFWITVFLNCGAFAWTFTPSGSIALRSLFAGAV